MICPWCVVRKFPAVILLLFTTLPGILQAKIHKCLREFDPSNCNALEEVWAFDVQEQECIGVIYGGCGKPKHLSNRFETRDECLQSCSHHILGQPSGPKGTESKVIANVKDSNSHVNPSALGLGRVVSGAAPVNVATNNSPNNMAELQNFRSNIFNGLNYLDTEIEKQPPPNVEQSQQGLFAGKRSSATFGEQMQPMYGMGQGELYYQQARIQPIYEQSQYIGQQPIYGTAQRPLPYERQPSWYAGQPQGYVWQPFPGSFVRPPVYGGQLPREHFYGQAPLLNNPPSPLYYVEPQAMNRGQSSGKQYVQNIQIGVPYWGVE